MIGRRQLRVRVLEALEVRVKQFRRREELWPLRVPVEPVLLEDVVEQALGDAHRMFDPATLRSRTLLHLEWEDGSWWDAWVVVLPSGIKLYCDTGGDETRVLASGGRNEGEGSDRAFLELLAESGGQHFGIEMGGGAPFRVRSFITDREFLGEMFVNLLEVAGAEDSLRQQLGDSGPDTQEHDFRSDVEKWLDTALAPHRSATER